MRRDFKFPFKLLNKMINSPQSTHPNKIVANHNFILEQKALTDKIKRVKSNILNENPHFIRKLHMRRQTKDDPRKSKNGSSLSRINSGAAYENKFNTCQLNFNKEELSLERFPSIQGGLGTQMFSEMNSPMAQSGLHCKP